MSERRRLVRVHPDKVGGLDKEGSAAGQEGPRYFISDQLWKIADFPEPLAPKPDITAVCPPGMTRDQENKLWAQLQKYKEQAKNIDGNSNSA